MNSLLKHPLSIYLVWHPEYRDGGAIASAIYGTFCREVDNPLSRGLGIPVYFRSEPTTGGQPIPILKSGSKRNAIGILVDENFVADPAFHNYASKLAKLADDSTRIFPIKLCDEADSIKSIAKYQFIRPPRRGGRAATGAIITELLHDCARLMVDFHPTWEDHPKESEAPSPVKLFISHTKWDEHGLETAKRFKAYVDGNLKLNVFFDALDIADGDEWEPQIEKNIKQSALVVFLTDAYASREWCRREVIVAKRNKCPMVVVHQIKKGEDRAFPYLGNIPTISLQDEARNDRFEEIVDLTLRQVINNRNQLELLESFAKFWKLDAAQTRFLTSPPELFNYLDITRKNRDSKKLTVLYPDPPLGLEELQLLSEFDDRVSFITPIQLSMHK